MAPASLRSKLTLGSVLLIAIAVYFFEFSCFIHTDQNSDAPAGGGDTHFTHEATHVQVDEGGLEGFLKMSLFAAEGLPKYSKVPGLESLTFYLWEVDPKPIIMLENSHLKWYEAPSEKQLIGLQRYLMTKRFVPGDGIVIDMGINDGYIAALAAVHGYAVVGVDGQPECVRRFLFAKAINGWDKVQVYNNIMSNDPVSMKIQNGVCGGSSRYLEGDGTSPRLLPAKGISVEMPGKTEVFSKKLDDLAPTESIVFFHLDVEGAELSVLKSASRALSERRIKNLVWEFAPHRWSNERARALSEVKTMMADFTCRDMVDVNIESPFYSGGVIGDWAIKYEETENRRGIIDIWCTLREGGALSA